MRRRELLAVAGAALVSARSASFAQPILSKPLRVVVVANRYHEADGLMSAIGNQMTRNASFSAPYDVSWPGTSPALGTSPSNFGTSRKPRCLIDIRKAPTDKDRAATMEVWCIDDLVDSKGDSAAKASAMDAITNYANPPGVPDGVVAFGTAGYPGPSSNDGCAAIGGTMFIRDASNDFVGTHGDWSWPSFMGTLVPSKTPAAFFSNIASDGMILDAISSEMIAPRNHPAGLLQLLIAADAVGISSVNIPAVPAGSPAPYCAVDTKSIAQAQAAGATNITSVETTHGVIRSKWPEAAFIYVTAIPNRVCHFPDEASGIYAQEFPSSHNAGVALKHVMPHFVSAIAT